MASFNIKKGACSYETIKEGDEIILLIHCDKCSYSPSIEDNAVCMSETVDKIIEVGAATKIIFSQKRDYEYDFEQVNILVEIANLYKKIMREKSMFGYYSISKNAQKDPLNKTGEITNRCQKCATERYNEIHNEIIPMIKGDPIGAYVLLRRLIRKEKIRFEKDDATVCKECIKRYLSIIQYVFNLLDNLKLINQLRPSTQGYKVGDRTIYRQVFYPVIKPDFMFTKLMADYPTDGEEMDNYILDDGTEVTIFKFPNKVQYLYHMIPPEFQLSEEKYELLDTARKIMSEHKPKQDEFTDPERMRQVFFNIGRDLIEELALHQNIALTQKDTDRLTTILVRYTVGFGLIEVLLQDQDVQDISINSPMGKVPIFIVHGKYDDCVTNITPTKSEGDSWASKLRMISGRPLDEADPILDTELELPGASTRVSVVTKPLNPTGLAYSFRRHRDKPWTLALFIKYKMITPLAAGLISFLVDGTRTMLIAGTRSAGKSSVLSAVLIEIMRRYRIITIEDTLELPTNSMRKLGFNIQSLKVASALSKDSTEMNASDGIRSTLRLGDSALIVGEVRSGEAKALYEAMRVGAAANVVAGTIHGDSPYGIYDRVVNDIGVPKTSFKATDIMIVANPVRSADGIHKYRRITQITEVRKHWEEDPMAEKGFGDLMKYNAITDKLEPTDELVNGDSDVLKAIAANIKEFSGSWDAVWQNILLRAKIKETLVKYAEKADDNDLLEAEFVIQSNDQFHLLSDSVKEETGSIDTEKIFIEWEDWLKKELKKRYKKDIQI